jgi:hypothetical protein
VFPLARDVMTTAAASSVWVWPENVVVPVFSMHVALLRQQLAVYIWKCLGAFRSRLHTMCVHGPFVVAAATRLGLLLVSLEMV